MCHYKHLTLIAHEKILLFYAEKKSATAIAELPGRSKSTISRELLRNTSDDEYIPTIAEDNDKECRKKCRRRKVLGYKTSYEVFYDKSLHLT